MMKRRYLFAEPPGVLTETRYASMKPNSIPQGQADRLAQLPKSLRSKLQRIQPDWCREILVDMALSGEEIPRPLLKAHTGWVRSSPAAPARIAIKPRSQAGSLSRENAFMGRWLPESGTWQAQCSKTMGRVLYTKDLYSHRDLG
jgi:hypothetical protein